MTKELLEQYSDIVKEIDWLKAQSRTSVVDVVQASNKEIPYQKHTVLVSGSKTVYNNAGRIKGLENLRDEILSFVDSRPTSKQRRVLQYRILEGVSWGEVAAKMGYRYSEDGVRKIYNRIF